jgi:hypothetical protein
MVEWTSLTCEASGTVDRVEHVSQFTAFAVRASLELAQGSDGDQARRLLRRAEQTLSDREFSQSVLPFGDRSPYRATGQVNVD